VEFAKKNSIPILFEFDEDTIEPIFEDGNAALILFSEEDSSKPFQEAVAAASKELYGEIIFATSGVTEHIQPHYAEFIRITKADLPLLHLIDPTADNAKYFYSGAVADLTVDAIKSFVADFKGGKLEPVFMSEEIPKENNKPVTVVVGKTWNEIVKDPTKDVFVKYYAPWCQHC